MKQWINRRRLAALVALALVLAAGTSCGAKQKDGSVSAGSTTAPADGSVSVAAAGSAGEGEDVSQPDGSVSAQPEEPAAPAYDFSQPAPERDPVDLDRLPEYPYIHYVTDPLLQDVLDDWWYSRYQEAPRTTIVTDAMDTAMKMVQQGLGFTLLSQSCGQDTPDIRPIPLTNRDGSPLMRKTWLYYRRDYRLVSSVKAFVEFMESKY